MNLPMHNQNVGFIGPNLDNAGPKRPVWSFTKIPTFPIYITSLPGIAMYIGILSGEVS